MRKKIAFRVDGNKEIGLGHFVRCISLANMLKKEYEICFYVVIDSSDMKRVISSHGFDVVSLDSEEVFFNYIDEKTIVVLDGYHFTEEYQQKIKKKNSRLVSIDDLHENKNIADLVINHVPGVLKDDYDASSYTQFALGVDYALLRPLFLEQASKKRQISVVDSVFICFGGTDHKNITCRVLNIVKKFKGFKKIIVVSGLSYPYQDLLSELMMDDNRIIHHHNVNEADMLSLMLETELAIVPASGILYEAIAAGNLIITGMYTDHQRIFLREFSKLDNVLNAGNFSHAELTSTIAQSFEISYENKQVIDGKSGSRLLELFHSI